MTRQLGIVAVLVGGLLLGLTYLALQSALPDADRHERTLEAMRTLTLSEAALQRDILRTRAGLLPSYDPLVRSLDDLFRAAASLREAGTAATGGAREEIEGRAEAIMAAVQRQAELVESFKGQNALLRNSLAYFSHLANELGGSNGARNSAAADAGELANAMFRFVSGQSGEAEPEVVAALDRLDRSSPPDSLERSTRTLVTHGRLIVGTLPAVDDLVAGILAAPIGTRTRAMQDAYLDFYGRAAARADVFRMLLYAAASSVAVYLGYLFFRFRSNARILRSRLAFEGAIAAISTAFINLPRDRIGDGIEAGLARLGQHTNVDRAALVIGDDTRAERAHAWSREGAGASALSCEDMLAVAAHWSLGSYEREGWVHVPDAAALPEGAERACLLRAGIRTWLCIPVWRAGERIGFLSFGSLETQRWRAGDIALLRTAAEIFANAIERARTEAEREALEARLAQAQRLEAVGTLAGGIAHEFNNILGVILGSAELALGASATNGRRHLRQILKASERARDVVDKVLTFSRRRDLERHAILVQPVVAEALDLIRASLPSTVTLSAALDAADAAICGDPTELQQVVMNLCTNAAQAMDGRGTIEIALESIAVARERALSHGSLAPGPHIRLCVRDAGRGMDAATLQHIFEPFFTTKPVGSGTGLGLPTVHGIVTQQGGTLNVESHPGAGSRFEIFWPSTAPPADDAAFDRRHAMPQGHGETVLLVDDEAPLVLLGEEMLAALGYEPVGYAGSQAALSAFRADPQRFDLALLDEIMPEMTGSELAAAMHEIHSDLPIVLMTGYRGSVPADRLTAAGIGEILAKPLRSASLADCLARHLSAPRRLPEALRR